MAALFFFLNLFFNWGKIALQCCVGFCCTKMQISHNYTYVPWTRAWQPTPVFLPGESPWTEEPGGLQSIASQKVGRG